ncbi:caspase-8-like [Saccostrea cucullata]|uniref:caspase-8-like n=1 Tax=Saccostrea cuccullata TaxID=36930 RepID=UPI002ED0DC9B
MFWRSVFALLLFCIVLWTFDLEYCLLSPYVSLQLKRHGRISVNSAELYDMLTDVSSGTGRRDLGQQEEGDIGNSGKVGSHENLHQLPQVRPRRTTPVSDMSVFTVGNRSKSFPFKKDLPSPTSSVRKLDARSLEKELLVQFKNRRLHPHSHVQMGINKSPRQRLQNSFYPHAKQLAVQSLDQFQHNVDSATMITCTADDHITVDVMDTSDVMSKTVHMDNQSVDGRIHNISDTKTTTPKSRFNTTSTVQNAYFDSEQKLIPKWRSLNDVSDSAFYSTTRKPRGYAVIINNYEFYKEMIALTHSGPQTLRMIQKGLRRDASIEDADKLSRFFRDELHFIVKGYANVPAYDMIKILSDVSNADHAQFDAFVCCIASHGRRGTLFGSDCREIKVEDVTSLFTGSRCVSLSGKPKCFFIQGCRGDHYSLKGILSGPANGVSRDQHYIPPTSDFLIGYSMVKDCTEFHVRQSESLLYKTLLKYYRKYSKRYDLVNIIVRVKKTLAKLQEKTIGAENVFECNFRAQLAF